MTKMWVASPVLLCMWNTRSLRQILHTSKMMLHFGIKQGLCDSAPVLKNSPHNGLIILRLFNRASPPGCTSLDFFSHTKDSGEAKMEWKEGRYTTGEGSKNVKGSRQCVCSYTQNRCETLSLPTLRTRLPVLEHELLPLWITLTFNNFKKKKIIYGVWAMNIVCNSVRTKEALLINTT